MRTLGNKLRTLLSSAKPAEERHMNDRLSERDWQELTDLITTAPPQRIRLAMKRVNALCAPTKTLLTEVDRLLHLAAISSGDAFDRALLVELRRLSVH